MSEQNTYIIGIAGGSASGKTTFINQLKGVFDLSQLCVISQDNYYRSLSDQHKDENGEVNFDLPEAIDFKRLVKDVKSLKKGIELRMPEYTFNNPNVFPKEIVFQPARILIIEGLFIFTHEPLSKMFDLTVFIEARPDVMFERRMRRDFEERGISKKQIKYQWDQHFMPAYHNFMMPYRDQVDLVIMNNKHFNNSFKVIVDHINKVILS